MKEYISKLTTYPLARGGDEERDMAPEEHHEFRSLLAKVRWLVARMVPQLAYSVSALTQKDPKGHKVMHLRVLNEVITRLKDYDNQGLATLRIRPVDLANLQVLTLMDASFAKEVGCKSQMGFMSMLTNKRVLEGSATCCLVEFQSTTRPSQG